MRDQKPSGKILVVVFVAKPHDERDKTTPEEQTSIQEKNPLLYEEG